MALTTKTRNAMPKSDFGLPAQRKYPMENKAHAANAKARAAQQYAHGQLTKAQLDEVNAKANQVLSGK